MRVRVLGPVTVDDKAVGSRRDRVVISALAVHTDRPVPNEQLADALWGAEPPASASKIVQGCIARLRKELGPEAIDTHPGGYRLDVSPDDIDARRFERLVRRAETLLALDEPHRAAHAAAEALALWRGRAFADLDGWDDGRVERERLGELRRDAEELHLDAQLRAGRHLEVLDTAQRLVADAGLRERRWALLARAQYQMGRQADALQTLHRARVMLSTELGLDPSPDLVALQDQILHQDPDLAAPPPPAEASAVCPYMGLVPYDVDDAEAFFGRADDIDACLGRLDREGVLAVVGPSGSGKSSLVRAGIAARLRRDGRRVAVITPGAHPMDALTALPTTGPEPVLVVDQCEQAVTLCDDLVERRAFFQALGDREFQAPLVVALRADRLGDLSTHASVAHAVERALYLLGPMGSDELRAAIERPATQAGLLVEPGLVDLLIREVEDEPGALPLLSHALRTTWERREGRTLTVAGYTEGGGIRGAVAKTADAVYERLSPSQQALLRDLVLRLVVQTRSGEPARARLARGVIADDPAHEALIEELVAARLLTSDDVVIELAHDAIIRAWPRLQEWIDEDATGQRILQHLGVAANAWQQMGRLDSELYRGIRLAQAIEWRDRAAPHLTPVEQAFLTAGEDLAERERRSAEERAQRQERINRRLRSLLAGIGVLAIVAVIAGVLAQRQATRADAEATAADARRVGAQALATDDIDHALLLAVEGWRLDDSPDTRANLLTTLGRSPGLVGVIRGTGDGVFGDVSVSPDGATVAVYDDANRVWFHDARSGATRASYEAGGIRGRALHVTGRTAFHPNGGPLAVTLSTTGERPVRLLDPTTFEEVPEQLGGIPPGELLPWDVAYSPDGSRLAVAFDRFRHSWSRAAEESMVAVWDTNALAEPLVVLEDVPPFTHGLAFSPDGELLYTGTHDVEPALPARPAVTVYDVTSGEVDRTIQVPSHPFAIHPDGGMIAAPLASSLERGAVENIDVAARSNEVAVFDDAGVAQRRLRGHTAAVLDVAFSPGGTLLATASADGTVIVWNPSTGHTVHRFTGHAGPVSSVAFAPHGRTLFSAGLDRAILMWDVTGTQRFVPSTSIPGRKTATRRSVWREPHALFSPTAQHVVYVWWELHDHGRARMHLQFVDVTDGTASPVIDTTQGGPIGATAWHPTGLRLASVAGLDQHVRIWDARTGDLIDESPFGLNFGAGATYLGPDQLLLGRFGGALQRIDARTYEPKAERLVIPRAADALTYASPDGATAAVITEAIGTGPYPENLFLSDSRLVLIDVDAHQMLHELDLGFDAEWAAFSPKGERVAVTGRGGQVGLVDVATGTFISPPVVGHDGNVTSIDYAPDGATVVSGGVDGHVTLWDGETGALRASIQVAPPHENGLAVAVKPDGTTVSVATWDGDIHTLDIRPERWAAAACRIAGRNLTRAEWRDAFGDRPWRATCPAP